MQSEGVKSNPDQKHKGDDFILFFPLMSYQSLTDGPG